jgi:hypothetical protein
LIANSHGMAWQRGPRTQATRESDTAVLARPTAFQRESWTLETRVTRTCCASGRSPITVAWIGCDVGAVEPDAVSDLLFALASRGLKGVARNAGWLAPIAKSSDWWAFSESTTRASPPARGLC